MRGARKGFWTICLLSRIIPAYAGSTWDCPIDIHVWRDHPRVCGEHGPCAIGALLTSGSSPRMRGAPFGLVWKTGVPGIIPAYAGSTGARPAACPVYRDHPRVCGEHESLLRMSNST